MARRRRVYWIGPESVVYHRSPVCPRILNSCRYYPLRDAALGSEQGRRVVAERRACKVCVSS